jgi:hypothetical protein
MIGYLNNENFFFAAGFFSTPANLVVSEES